MKVNDFCNKLEEVVFREGEKIEDTERYLRVLMGQILKNRNEPLTTELFLKIWELSWEAEPVEFTNEWNSGWPWPELVLEDWRDAKIKEEIYESLAIITRFVIDLREMQGVPEDQLMDGYESSRGSTWNNFTVSDMVFIYCGSPYGRGEEDIEGYDPLDWDLFGEILTIGRSWE